MALSPASSFCTVSSSGFEDMPGKCVVEQEASKNQEFYPASSSSTVSSPGLNHAFSPAPSSSTVSSPDLEEFLDKSTFEHEARTHQALSPTSSSSMVSSLDIAEFLGKCIAQQEESTNQTLSPAVFPDVDDILEAFTIADVPDADNVIGSFLKGLRTGPVHFAIGGDDEDEYEASFFGRAACHTSCGGVAVWDYAAGDDVPLLEVRPLELEVETTGFLPALGLVPLRHRFAIALRQRSTATSRPESADSTSADAANSLWTGVGEDQVADQDVLTFRFCALREAHSAVASTSGLRFPSRHLARGVCQKKKLAQLRAVELGDYLTRLLNDADLAADGAIISHPRLHAALGCSDSTAARLIALGEVRRQALQKGREAEEERREAEMMQWQADRSFVHTWRGYGSPLTLRFRVPLHALSCLAFSSDTSILGPGPVDPAEASQWMPWFCVRDSLAEEAGGGKVLAAAADDGESLLAFHRNFSWESFSYRLDRVAADGSRKKLCEVSCPIRQRSSGLRASATMRVTPLGSMMNKARVEVRGRWGQEGFSLLRDGCLVCRVTAQTADSCEIELEPRHDIALFLGILCAMADIQRQQ